MNNQRTVVYILLCFGAIFFAIGGNCTVAGTDETATDNAQLTANTVSSQITFTQSLVLVFTAVIIIAEIILLFKISKGKHKKIDGKATNENQETADFKNTIEKIRNLEAEKKSLLIEIEELKKTADAKATALESEVNALRDEMTARKSLMNGSEPSVEPKLKENRKNKKS